MIRRGLFYGVLSARRRSRALILPAVTTATGAFLLVQVLANSAAVRADGAALGDESEILRATVLIAVVVLLVGVVEVAVCTTRTIVQRTREMGVLSATGVRRMPVVAALLVEPLVAAVVGAIAGSLACALMMTILGATGSASMPPAATTAEAGVLAVVVSAAAACLASFVPSFRAASRPPIVSLSA